MGIFSNAPDVFPWEVIGEHPILLDLADHELTLDNGPRSFNTN